jgi:hypothetical protein
MAKAIVRGPEGGPYGFNREEEDVKLVCVKCGYNKHLAKKPTTIISGVQQRHDEGQYFIIGDSIDPYFHQPLWLSMKCCGETLWAYNYEHLNFLKHHVEAKLRERTLDEIKNKSLGSRLPKWMTSKRNRSVVVNAIEQLSKK